MSEISFELARDVTRVWDLDVPVVNDPENKSITVEFESPATLEQIKETLKEINYPAA